MTITADSGIKAGAALVNGGKVVFTVKIDANDVAAADLVATFRYNKNVLTFVAEESSVAGIFDIEGEIATQSIIGNNAEEGVVTILANASNDAEGNLGEKTLVGEVEIATLVFEINEGFYNDATWFEGYIEIAAADATDTGFVVDDYAEVEIETEKRANINGDASINVIDVQAIRNLINAKEYSAVADIDMDGKVDLFDYAALRQFLASAKSYDAYFNPSAPLI